MLGPSLRTGDQAEIHVVEDFSCSKEGRVVPSAGKVMASVFWDAKSSVLIDYFKKDKTINVEYHANLLRKLLKAIKSKRPRKLTKSVLFHQDNALAHNSVVAMSTVHDCGFKLTNIPSYSPDWGPPDYFLFPNHEKTIWQGTAIRLIMTSFPL